MTVYPNLNLLEGSKKYTKSNPKTISSNAIDYGVVLDDVCAKNLKAGTYTMSAKADAPWVKHYSPSSAREGHVGLWLVSKTPGLNVYINLGDTVPKTIEVPKDGDYCVRVNIYSNGKDTVTHSFWDFKLEPGSTATPYMPSASEVTTADISEYFGYNYIENQAYTYYGETNIDRLSRWDIKDEIFSFMGILYPKLPKTPTGVRFLDDIGNEYTAIVFKTEQVQNYILINTDVNDEIYQGWNGTTSLNLFPVMDFERYRTRIIEKGQMELINLSKAEFKIKRKADFV